MSGASVSAKVKAGLRKANIAVGENPNPIYKEVKTLTGGDGITPPSETIENVQLVDAIFKSPARLSASESFISGSLIKSGDIAMVSNADVKIGIGDFIVSGSDRYLVVSILSTPPAGIPLVYQSILRKQ